MKNKIIISLLLLAFNLSAQTVPVSVQHDPVTITDGSQVDLTITGQNISGGIVSNSLDSSFIKDKTIRLLELNQSGASTGHIPRWDGSKWAPVSPPYITKEGIFKTTSNPKGLSTTADSLSLHAATYTTPGAISLSDQFLGQGKKTVSKESNGVSTGLVIYNALAADGDLAEGIGMDFLGGGETPMMGFYAVQNDVTGSTGIWRVRNAIGQTDMITCNGESKTISHTGFQINPSVTVSGIIDATVDINKSSSYILLSGSTLLLPDPTTLPDGTYVNFTSTNVTGSSTIINTTSGAAEFWLSSGVAAISDVTILIGSVKTGKCEIQTVLGTKYWVVTIY